MVHSLYSQYDNYVDSHFDDHHLNSSRYDEDYQCYLENFVDDMDNEVRCAQYVSDDDNNNNNNNYDNNNYDNEETQYTDPEWD